MRSPPPADDFGMSCSGSGVAVAFFAMWPRKGNRMEENVNSGSWYQGVAAAVVSVDFERFEVSKEMVKQGTWYTSL